MQSLLNYLNIGVTDAWQVIGVDTVFKRAFVLAPKGHSTSTAVKGLISLSHCSVFVLVHPDSVVADLKLYTVEPNNTPHYGLLALLYKKLFAEQYQYGIIQLIT